MEIPPLAVGFVGGTKEDDLDEVSAQVVIVGAMQRLVQVPDQMHDKLEREQPIRVRLAGVSEYLFEEFELLEDAAMMLGAIADWIKIIRRARDVHKVPRRTVRVRQAEGVGEVG